MGHRIPKKRVYFLHTNLLVTMECLESKIEYVRGCIGKNNRWDGWDDVFVENNSVWWIRECVFEIVCCVLSRVVWG